MYVCVYVCMHCMCMYVCLYVSVYVCIYIQLSLVPTPHFKIVLKLKTKINKTYGGHWHTVPTVLSIDDINLIVIMNVYKLYTPVNVSLLCSFANMFFTTYSFIFHFKLTKNQNIFFVSSPPKSLQAILAGIADKVNTDEEYIFEVRREQVLADCLRNVSRYDFSPSKIIKVFTISWVYSYFNCFLVAGTFYRWASWRWWRPSKGNVASLWFVFERIIFWRLWWQISSPTWHHGLTSELLWCFYSKH